MLYATLWGLELLAILALISALTLPIFDHSLRAFIDWQQHPSSETYTAYITNSKA